jgi:hypothetical protein
VLLQELREDSQEVLVDSQVVLDSQEVQVSQELVVLDKDQLLIKLIDFISVYVK